MCLVYNHSLVGCNTPEDEDVLLVAIFGKSSDAFPILRQKSEASHSHRRFSATISPHKLYWLGLYIQVTQVTTKHHPPPPQFSCEMTDQELRPVRLSAATRSGRVSQAQSPE